MCRFSFCLLAWLGLAVCGHAQTTYHVPGDFSTIQAAVAAAGSGDTVIVGPGTYIENVVIFAPMTLKSSHGPEVTRIFAATNSSVINVGFQVSAVIDGFTVSNGTGSFALGEVFGGGIFIEGPSTVRNCIVRNNRLVAPSVGYAKGGGIAALAATLIEDCVISDNDANNTGLVSGGGIYLQQSGGPRSTVQRCIIANNTVAGAQAAGGGIYSQTSADIIDCEIRGNIAGSGGGLEGAADMLRCEITGNVATATGGGGVRSYNGSLINCMITDNRSIGASPGAVYTGLQRTTIINCTIVNNQAPSWAVWHHNGQAGIYNSIIWGNSNDNLGSAFPTLMTVEDSVVEGGWTGPGNLNVDPQLYDMAGGDYRLVHTSPCIDEAPSYTAAGPTDFEGDARVVGSRADIGADEFYGLGASAIGAVGDVLLINGEDGGADRRITLPPGDMITIGVGQPAGQGGAARFLIAGYVGVPDAALVETLPFGLGDFSFPLAPLHPAFPGLFVLTSSYAPYPGQLVTSTPAPWSVTFPGPPIPVALTFQGLIDRGPGDVARTNGIVLEVR